VVGKSRSVVDIVEECRKLSVVKGKNFYKCLEEKGLLKPIFTVPGKPDKVKKPVFRIPEEEPGFTIPEKPDKKHRKKRPPIETQPIPIDYAK
jgi:hypothetical protein